ncbi:MAG: DUF1320 domain-containing protein [Melioribacteraceae bacterium]|nr:DUF1320 domain-containing protein [Melioribacteraceae bacterium]MCF8414558.1 DUF1320 domain-containing protein [Melioribacteraceae bacterium]
MYCSITDILNDLDQKTLIHLCNDENRSSDVIDLADSDDAVVKRVNAQIESADDEIDPFLIPLKVLPFTTVPDRIKTLSIKIAIKNLYFRSPSFKTKMPESIMEDYSKALKELDAYRKKDRIIPGLEEEESAKPSSKIIINKKTTDRLFDTTTLGKF